MAKLFANSGDPDQTPCSAASDLGLHYLPSTFYGYPDYNGLTTSSAKCVKVSFFFFKYHTRDVRNELLIVL